MKTFLNKILNRDTNTPLDEFVKASHEVSNLPPLSSVEAVKFEHDIAIDHLYYSSKIEGTALDDKRLNQAIHAA